MVSLAHGTNDAQKTMGVITLALIASGHWNSTTSVPLWVKFACALAISAGTFFGGWRIIRTVGKGLVEISSPQGMAAETSSAVVILASSHLGFALSTTQVASGSVLGSGVGRPGATVRWAIAGRMVVAWMITMPAAGIVGAVMWWVADIVGGVAGAIVTVVLLVAFSLWMWLRAQHAPITPENVNDAWEPEPPRTEEQQTVAGRR
jgi:PiT family inorganic phosphate transporter